MRPAIAACPACRRWTPRKSLRRKRRTIPVACPVTELPRSPPSNTPACCGARSPARTRCSRPITSAHGSSISPTAIRCTRSPIAVGAMAAEHALPPDWRHRARTRRRPGQRRRSAARSPAVPGHRQDAGRVSLHGDRADVPAARPQDAHDAVPRVPARASPGSTSTNRSRAPASHPVRVRSSTASTCSTWPRDLAATLAEIRHVARRRRGPRAGGMRAAVRGSSPARGVRVQPARILPRALARARLATQRRVPDPGAMDRRARSERIPEHRDPSRHRRTARRLPSFVVAAITARRA